MAQRESIMIIFITSVDVGTVVASVCANLLNNIPGKNAFNNIVVA